MIRAMRVGLVLGGGGVRGASWLMGALHGLAAEIGWDPGSADLVVGTSAGAVVAALTLAGARPWDALAPDREELLRAMLDGAAFNPELTLRSLWPGSPPLVGRALRAGPAHVMKVVAGALPEARSGAPVFLHWRNLTRHSGWATEAAAPLSDATGSWSNFIPNADPSDRYQIWISSPTTASPTCTYAADGGPHLCR